MKIKYLCFVFGLMITLQELIFLLENSTIAYAVIVIIAIFLHSLVAIHKKQPFKLIRGYSALRLLYILYLLLILISGSYFFEKNYFRWLIGLTPFVITIPFLNITYSSNIDNFKTNIVNTWNGIAWGAFFILIVILINGASDRGRLSFEIFSPSAIGRNCTIVIFYAIFQLLNKNKRYKIIYYSLILTSLIVLLMSGSKSSILALLIVGLFIIIKFRLFSVKLVVVLAITAIGLMLTPYFDMFLETISLYQSSDYLTTFTGRTIIWEEIIYFIEQKPWFGYGYNSPSLLLTKKYIEIMPGVDIIQAHNAFLQSMLNLGIVGTSILFLIIVFIFKEMKRIYLMDKAIYMLLMPIFLFLLIRGFTEASFANGHSVDVFIFSIIIYNVVLLKIVLREKIINEKS